MDTIFFFDTAGSIVAHSTDAPVFAVKAFERGYYPIYTPLTADQLNKGRYTAEELAAALAASVFGWHVPGAREAVQCVQRIEEQQARGSTELR